eukprot:2395699-Prymnesium_polylepis.1
MRRLLHKSSTNLLMVGPHSLKPFIDPDGELPYYYFENDIERILARGQNILKISARMQHLAGLTACMT